MSKFSIFFPKVGWMLDDYHLSRTSVLLIINVLYPVANMLTIFLFVIFSSMVDDEHILRKLQPKGIWYLTVLGSLATTQREYVALHAFRRLNLQVTIEFIYMILVVVSSSYCFYGITTYRCLICVDAKCNPSA